MEGRFGAQGPRIELERAAAAARDRGDYAGWLAARQAICEADPRSVDAWMRLAYVHRYAEHYAQAHAAYAKALEIDPAYLPARYVAAELPESPLHASDASIAAFASRWASETAAMARLAPHASAEIAEKTLALGTNFHMHYVQRDDVAAQRAHAAVIEPLARTVARVAPAIEGPPRDGRRRVVFLSPFFRRHTITRLFAGLVERLPRERFDVVVMQLDTARDAVTERLAANVSHLVSGEYRLPEWIALLRSAKPDVVVFVDVGMHPLSQALAAIRFAPAQFAMWGHPVTTAYASIDRFLSSEVLEPADGERHYTEALVRMPGLGAWYEPPDVSVEPAAEAAPLVLLPASVHKLLPRFDRLVARIAARVPDARFVALPSRRAGVRDAYEARVRRAFLEHGADPARIEVRAPVGESEFFALARQSTLWLDTPEWSGGMTAIDLLSIGLPCVALEGGRMRARQTAALLRFAGADECVAADDDDYVDKAVRLLDPAHSTIELSARLRESMGPLQRDERVPAFLAALLG